MSQSSFSFVVSSTDARLTNALLAVTLKNAYLELVGEGAAVG